jgi:cytochrome c oxidase accessory protein FixG
MSKHNPNELHEERLASTDETGHRVYLYPEDIKGFWRDRRHLFYWFLIFIYLVLPWINFKGRQIILLDLPAREFTFFGMTYYAHDAPLVLLLLLFFVFSMGFLTSIFGRVWCGWACPQTVFIDTIYRKIERIVEGKARQRKKLDDAPWSLEKVFKKAIKWVLFLVVTLHISHSFLGYFVGARKLFWITLSPPQEHWTLFTIMLFITTILLLDFGWFREQFCIIACPYGRIQSVMMDEHSLVVAYDEKRGEPRQEGRHKDGDGDCINCFHCVKACPTGIDIRRGTQLECIACTNCIDACDEIMVKTGKEPGLIRYDTEAGLKGEERKVIRPRNLIYLTAIIAVVVTLGFAIRASAKLHATFLRVSDSPYKVIHSKDGEDKILNLYRVRLDYNGNKEQDIHYKFKDNKMNELIHIASPKKEFNIHKGRPKTILMHFTFKKDVLSNGNKVIELEFLNTKNKVLLTKEVKLVGPLN